MINGLQRAISNNVIVIHNQVYDSWFGFQEFPETNYKTENRMKPTAVFKTH